MISRQRQIDEIIKCGKDPIYFMNEWCKIQHSTKGLIKFKTFEFQNDCVKNFEEKNYNIVVKARQLGLSTVTAAYALWMALFRKDKNILVLATKLKTAQGFLKKVKTILSHLPKWLMLTSIEAINKTEVEFDNGSQIAAIATGEDAARGEALSLLIIDEAALIRDLDDLWAGLFPTVSDGGKVIMISTPFGVGGFYHRTWVEAEAGLNEFNPIKLMWDVHPDRDETWFAKITRNMSAKKVAQEYLCNFLTSGDTFIQSDDIDYIRSMISNPISKEGPEGCVWVWRKVEPGEKYVISADVARGDATDFSGFHVINSSTCEVVCEYKGLIPPDDLASLMVRYGDIYNKALLCPENNSFGYSTAMQLQELEYTNLYYEKSKVDMYSKAAIKRGIVPGFTTQAKSRLQILNKLEELIRNKILKIHSQRFYDEICSFSWSGGKAQAIKGAHDDLIMSLSIGVWIMDVVIPSTINSSASTVAALSNMSVSSRKVEQIYPDMSQGAPLVSSHVRYVSDMFENSKKIDEMSILDHSKRRSGSEEKGKGNKDDKEPRRRIRGEFDWLF